MKLRNWERIGLNIAEEIWEIDERNTNYYFYIDSSILPPDEYSKELDEVSGFDTTKIKYETYESYKYEDHRVFEWLNNQEIFSSSHEKLNKQGEIGGYKCTINWEKLDGIINLDKSLNQKPEDMNVPIIVSVNPYRLKVGNKTVDINDNQSMRAYEAIYNAQGSTIPGDELLIAAGMLDNKTTKDTTRMLIKDVRDMLEEHFGDDLDDIRNVICNDHAKGYYLRK